MHEALSGKKAPKAPKAPKPVLLREVNGARLYGAEVEFLGLESGEDGKIRPVSGARAVRYVGWGAPAPDPDPAGALSEADMTGPAGLLTSWTRGAQSSPELHAAIVAARGGRKPCGCTPCRRARMPHVVADPRDALDVDAARAVPVLAVCLALGVEGLRPAGRTHRGPCPLHGGKDPNFSVGPSFFRCHSCGAHGDGIRLAMDLGGMTFRDAVAAVLAAR